jgi:hypothetical protein
MTTVLAWMNTMLKFKCNQEFYDHIDALSASIEKAGFTAASRRLFGLVHKVAWSTSTELFYELKNALLAIFDESRETLPRNLSDDVRACVQAIDEIL